jgi:hypothetical protein
MKKALSLVAVSGIGLLASAAGAQQSDSSLARCDSVLRAARHDSMAITARAYLLRRDGDVLTPRARSLLTDAILAHFQPPRPLQIPVFAAGPTRMRMLKVEQLEGDSIVSRTPVLYGAYDFSLLATGAPSRVTITIPTLAKQFDSSIVRAIMASASDSTLAEVARALKKDSIPLELRISTAPEDTRLRVPATTLFTAYFPRLSLVDAKPLSTNKPAPYPDEELDDGEDGEAVLRVVVDASGTPRISTLEVLHATTPAFALAAGRALTEYKFVPAHVGSCPVPQVVELPFWFSLKP